MNAWKPVTVVQLEAEACAIAGSSDFGGDRHREALTVLLADYAASARFGAEGAAATRALRVELLVQRLRSQRALQAFRSARPVVRPWFILAVPCSGTTALHRLLCSDPGAQGLEHWLGLHPQPRPPRERWAAHPDFRATAARLEGMKAAAPSLFAQHAMEPDAVDECRLLLMPSFASMTFSSNATLPNYERWLWTCDMAPAYARHRELLGLIDGGQGRRWVLKNSSHLMALGALVETYPDLRVLCTRRPAAEFLASIASLVFAAGSASEPGLLREQVGRDALAIWSRAAWALQRWRIAHPQVPWFDVDPQELRADAIGVCRRIHAAFDEPFTSEVERSMRSTLYSLDTGATLGRPTLEAFGLTSRDVAAAFPPEFL
jgi:hypothetical protein